MKKRFACWNVLLFQYLKRDWKKIIIWVIGLAAFSGGFVPAFEEIGKGQGLIGMYETMQNPAMISMVGPTPIDNALDYTIGAMYSNEMLLFCGLFAMVIAVLHVVGHTRKEEDLGLSEIVRSFKVGRQANSLAVIIETIIINALLAIFIGALMALFKVDSISVEGSFLFGASVGMAGIIGALIGLFFAQIMATSAGATGASLATIGLLYISRAGSDISNIKLSMFNPMGWTYLTYPFVKNDWLPLLFAIIFCIVMLIISFILEGKRDMGAGYLPEFEGRAYAKKSLLSVSGLLLKINKGIIIAWLITFVLMGAAYGSIYGDMQSFLESNDLMKHMFSQTGYSIEESFSATILMVMSGLVAILPIVVINKLFTEETRMRLSQVFSTKVSRTKLYFTTILISLIVGIVGLLLAAIGLGGTALSVMSDQSSMTLIDFISASLNFIPAILFFIGIAALALGYLPKAGKIIYAYLAYSFMLSYFGNILNLPEWFSKTTIFNWIPQLPVDNFELVTFIIITIISIILIIIGYLGYKNRDMIEGS